MNLKLNFENCYGIKKLNYEFNFGKSEEQKNRYIIYAQNGSMKSSFTKTFKDAAAGMESSDRVFKDRVTVREITCDGKEIDKDSIVAISGIDLDYRSDKLSTLVVNSSLSQEYQKIKSQQENLESELLKAIGRISGRNDVKAELLSLLHEDSSLYEALKDFKNQLLSQFDDSVFVGVKLNVVNDPKVQIQLNDPSFKAQLSQYIEKYDQLLEQSAFLTKDFSLGNATALNTTLDKDGFFKANHQLVLKNPRSEETIPLKDSGAFKKLLEVEIKSLESDEQLVKNFEKINKTLQKNASLKSFQNLITSNKGILRKLKDTDLFFKDLICYYVSCCKDQYLAYIDFCEENIARIKNIKLQAAKERTRWNEVVKIFNHRFDVPFLVEIQNHSDAVLSSDNVPVFTFKYKSRNNETAEVEYKELAKILSTGEKRALYLMNVIFEIEARRSKQVKTLYIIDDIADSFDYKNKYAIIEYLNDVANDENSNLILLTHNYDFYKTSKGRLNIRRHHCLKVTWTDQQEIKFLHAKYLKDPFNVWIKGIKESKAHFIALIPFFRNLADYSDKQNLKDSFTRVLHLIKNDDSLTCEEVFASMIELNNSLDKPPYLEDLTIYQFIYNYADSLLTIGKTELELEDKIALSIAIRLKTEQFIFSKMPELVSEDITRNQTVCLIRKFQTKYKDEAINAILTDVILMTPENIHMNAFMYEPLVDLSSHHLVKLYREVSELGIYGK